MRDIGANLEDVLWDATTLDEGPWLPGRGAKILVSGEEVGQIGEIDPVVASEFGLRVPIQAGEFDVDALGRLILTQYYESSISIIVQKRHRIEERFVFQMVFIFNQFLLFILRLSLVLNYLGLLCVGLWFGGGRFTEWPL